MRKYNEGYTLPFVLVVFLVISLVATSILTISLQNLQSQKASIQRMEEKYAAKGMMESKIASLMESVNYTGTFTQLESAQKAYSDHMHRAAGVTVNWHEEHSCIVPLSVETESVRVECELLLKNVIIHADGYTISSPAVSYLTYTVTSVENGGGST